MGTEEVGDKIFQILASDEDRSGKQRLVFSLLNGFSLFELDASSGVLRLAQLPDGKIFEWNLLVNVSDSKFTTQMKVVVHLELEAIPAFIKKRKGNLELDFQPFSMKHRVCYVEEGMRRGQVVSQITDLKNRNDVEVEITQGNADQAFALQFDNNGQVFIVTRTMLDAEIRKLYTLEVMALNKTNGREIQTCQISISVVDQNDNEPSLVGFIPTDQTQTSDFETFFIEGDVEIGHRLGTFQASDADSSSRVSFFVADEETARYFAINPISGDLFLKRKMDKSVEVVVEVSDGFHHVASKPFYFQFSSGKFPEAIVEKGNVVDFFDGKYAYEGSVAACDLHKNIFTIHSTPRVTFEVLCKDPNLSSLFHIDNDGALKMKEISLSPQVPDRLSCAIMAQASFALPQFASFSISGLRNCRQQPAILPSSVNLLELPQHAAKKMQPGTVLVKLDVNESDGILFQLDSKCGRYFGIDSDANFRLLRPLEMDADISCSIAVSRPDSKHPIKNSHSLSVKVIETKQLDGGINYDTFFLHLNPSNREEQVLTFPDDSYKIVEENINGKFSMHGNILMIDSIKEGDGDNFAIVSNSTGHFFVVVANSRKIFPPNKPIFLEEIEEGNQVPNQHLSWTGAKTDCENECCIAGVTSDGSRNIPQIWRIIDHDEFAFGYEEENGQVVQMEVSEPGLIGCLRVLDFDNGAAGLWQLIISNQDQLPNHVKFSPFEGCFYLSHSVQEKEKYSIVVEEKYSRNKKTQVSIIINAKQSKSLENTSEPVPELDLKVVIIIAVPCAIVLVVVAVLFAFMLRKKWLKLVKNHHLPNENWIHRILQSSTKRKTMIGRTNSFNSIGFTSVKYDPRPPSAGRPENRRSLYLTSGSSIGLYQDIGGVACQVQQQSSLYGLHITPSTTSGQIQSNGTTNPGGFRSSVESSAASVSSGVELSSGANSCSPPPNGTSPPQLSQNQIHIAPSATSHSSSYYHTSQQNVHKKQHLHKHQVEF